MAAVAVPCAILMSDGAIYLLAAFRTRTSLFIVLAVLLLILSRLLASLSRGVGTSANGRERSGEHAGQGRRARTMPHELGPKFGVTFRMLSWSAVGLAVAFGILAAVEASFASRWESRSAQRVEAWRASDVAAPDSR